MKTTISLLLSLLMLAGAVRAQAALFGPKGDNPEEKRQTIRKQRDEMLAELFKSQPKLQDRLKKAAGYATFKQSDVNLFLLASGYGYGMHVDSKTGKETIMRVASLGGGVGLGVRDLRVVFVFNDPKVMQSFVDQGCSLAARPTPRPNIRTLGLPRREP